MESKYLEVAREVVRRRRRLNTLKGMRLGAMLALGATFLYLITVYLGLVGMIQPWWLLILFVVLAGWAGARWGWKRPIALQEDLYRVDRAFRLGEVLSTIYELRRYSRGLDFLEVLYRRIEGLAIDVKRALPLSSEERRGWVGLSGLALGSLLFMGLWLSGVPPLPPGWWAPLHQTLLSDPTEIVSPSADPQEQPKRPTPTDEVAQAAGEPQRSGNIPYAPRKGAPVRGEAYGPETGSSIAPPAGSLGEVAPGLSRALTELKERLERDELSPAQVREKLEQLAKQAPAEELREALQRAARAADAESMQRRLDEAASKLQRRQQGEGRAPEEGKGSQPQAAENPEDGSPSASQAGSSGQDGGLAEDEQHPSGSTDTKADGDGGQGEQAEPSTGPEQAGENGASTPNSEASPAEEGASSESEAKSEGDKSASEEGQKPSSSGEGVGHEPGRAAEAHFTPFEPSQDLLIQGGHLPIDLRLLDQLLTKGLPVDLLGPGPEGVPILRLDLARVEALLELRDLPPELRSLVRAYFLALAKEP
jgi:hypothetical protein